MEALISHGEKFRSESTQQLLAVSKALNKRCGNGQNEAAQYSSFLVHPIDVVIDPSKVVDEPEFLEKLSDGTFRRRPALRPEEKLSAQHEADVREGVTLMSLQDVNPLSIGQSISSSVVCRDKSTASDIRGDVQGHQVCVD